MSISCSILSVLLYLILLKSNDPKTVRNFACFILSPLVQLLVLCVFDSQFSDSNPVGDGQLYELFGEITP